MTRIGGLYTDNNRKTSVWSVYGYKRSFSVIEYFKCHTYFFLLKTKVNVPNKLLDITVRFGKETRHVIIAFNTDGGTNLNVHPS